MGPDVAVVIVCRHAQRAAASVRRVRSTAPDAPIWVVQAGPPDPRVDALAGAGVHVWLSEDAPGPVMAAESGAVLAGTPWIAWIDDSATPTVGWLAALLAFAAARPEVGLLVPAVVDASGAAVELGRVALADGSLVAFEGPIEGPCPVDAPGGTCVLVRAAAWEAARGLDVGYCELGAALADLAFHSRRRGWETWLVPSARVIGPAQTLPGVDVRRFARRFGAELAAHEPPPGRVVPTPDRVARGFGRPVAVVAGTGAVAVVAGPASGPFSPAARRDAVVQALGADVVADGDPLPAGRALAWVEAGAERALPGLRRASPGVRVIVDVRHRVEPGEPPTAEERWLWRQADRVVVASADLLDVVRGTGIDAAVVPDPWELGPRVRRPAGDEVVVLADFGTAAGAEAARFAAREILPRVVLARPAARLTLAGPGVGAVVALAGGNVAVAPDGDLPATLARAVVALAVERAGDGPVPGAAAPLAAGVPVVATPEVARRTGAGEGTTVANDAGGLAAGVVTLLRDEGAWYAEAVAGRARAGRTWGRPRVVRAIRALSGDQ